MKVEGGTAKITLHDLFLKNNHTSPHWYFNVMKFPDCDDYDEQNINHWTGRGHIEINTHFEFQGNIWSVW